MNRMAMKNIILIINLIIIIICQIVFALLLTYFANHYGARYMGEVTLLIWVLIIALALQIKIPTSFWWRLLLLISTMPISAIGWFVMMRVCFGLLPK